MLPADAEFITSRVGSHPFLRGRFGAVPDTMDGTQEFGTCWDMVWIYEDSTGQEVTVWWASVPRFCFWMMVGFTRCWWLQKIRRRRESR